MTTATSHLDEIVPIESLFYADAGPHIITDAPVLVAHGAALQSLLASGIAGLTPLGTEPFSEPAEIEDDALPIEMFLYRGRSALDRALELRGQVQRRGTPPESGEIEELFALLDLAVAE
jgi:hypothetical protein